MMKDDTQYLLDDILASWHKWRRGWNGAQHTSCAMFTGVLSSRQWDTENDVIDGALNSETMKAVDFHVDELEPIHRTALQIQARNLVTGRSVWHSARLPEDIKERAVILMDARTKLLTRLLGAGVL